ncbi:MAG: hypothetical protein ACLPND_11175 [Candidatus Korobacteraceae bacterium]
MHSSDTGLRASEAEGILAVVGPNRVETASHKRLLFAKWRAGRAPRFPRRLGDRSHEHERL